LSDKVASRLAERARQQMLRGNFSAGWRDLEHARLVAGDSREVLTTRQELLELVANEAEGFLRAGDSGRALALLAELDRKEQGGDGWRLLRDVARHLESARNLCRRGKFLEADSQLETAGSLRPDLEVIGARRQEYRELQQRSREIHERLHRALTSHSWTDALAAADRLLELAPDNRLAHDARKRAWAEVGAQPGGSPTGQMDLSNWSSSGGGLATCNCGAVSARGERQMGSRFLLWVDAVGGFLVCLNDQVTLGQAVPGSTVDVPILADLSRQHARISRIGDGYAIEPLADVGLNGRPVRQRTLLSDGDELTLGRSVRLRFRQPHALSATARLEFVSRHRTQPSADGVLLMAESCVLGPRRQNHVVCREWSADVVLYRQDQELFCRSMESFEIDGALCDGKGKVGRDGRITGEDFAMSLEAV
jgi:hypothetical protein